MAPIRQCATCGAVLTEGVPEGQCPECLIQLGLEAGVASADDPSDGGVGLLPRQFGDFTLLEEIARGGMGVVYRARQKSLDRIVAVKLILSGHFAAKDSIHRFRVEASAAAALQHPNIVAIHEVGVHQGEHYLSMDLVEGPNLTQFTLNAPLPSHRTARYLKAIAEAIHYAHERGILHRDLKPSNILIDASDQPRVTDFGLAKRLTGPRSAASHSSLEKIKAEVELVPAELTLTGQVLGSPNYIAPEQVSGKRGQVSRQSDVYSLGAILYHLLTARGPFVSDTVAETLQQVLHEEPLAPRLLNPGAPRDLETICLKCLQKEPGRRYATAQELADELGRFLRDEPIEARPVTWVEKAWRWCRRKPALAGAFASALMLLVVVAIGSPIAALRIKHEQRRTQRSLVAQYVANGTRLMNDGDLFGALLWYAESLRLDVGAPEQEEPHRMRIASVLQQCPKLINVFSHGTTIFSAEFSPRGDVLATASDDHTARIWDVATGKTLHILPHEGKVYHVAFSPDGEQIVTTSEDETVRIWNAQTGAGALPPLRHSNMVWHAAFSPDGQMLATVSADSHVRIWDVRTGELVVLPRWQNLSPNRVSFGPDRRLLAVKAYDKISLWDVAIGQPRFTNLTHSGCLSAASFSPDGNVLLTCAANSATMLDLTAGTPLPGGVVDEEWLDLALFSPDGRRILTCAKTRGARVWDTRTRQPLFPTTIGSSDETAAFSPDGSCFVTGGRDTTARVWDSDSGAPLTPPLRHSSIVTKVQFNADGHRFLTMAGQHIRVWDLATESSRHRPPKPAPAVERRYLDANFGRVLLPDDGNTLWLRDLVSGRTLSGPMPHPYPVLGTWFSPDGRVILSSYGTLSQQSEWETALSLWDTNGTRLNRFEMKQPNDFMVAAFSPDMRRMVNGGFFAAQVWEIPSGRHLLELPHNSRVIYVAFGADARTVITIGANFAVRVWDTASGQPLTRPLEHHKPLAQAIQTADSRRICVVALDGTIQYWDLASGEPLTPFLPSEANASAEGFQTWSMPNDARPAEDLVSLAQLYSLNQLDRNGLVGNLTRFAFTNSLQVLKKRYPAQFTSGPSDVTAWHRQQLDTAEAKGRTSVARIHLDPLTPRLNIPPQQVLFHEPGAKQFQPGNDSRIQRSWVLRQAGRRDPHCPPQCIDLTEFFNFALWDQDRPGSSFDGLQPGLTRLGGVFFDVRGMIRLARGAAGRQFPELHERIDGIRLGQKCNKLHFLQYAIWESPKGTQIGRYILHYRDGQSREVPIVFGEQVGLGWFRYDNELVLGDAKVVWTGSSAKARQDGFSMCLFLNSRDNPRPDMEIVSMDFVSEMTMSLPVLVALTVE